MVEECTFYTTRAIPSEPPLMDCDLELGLYRAGARLFWDFEKIAYVVESKYISRWMACGRTEDEALHAYGIVIQEPDNWRGVVQELFQYLPRFEELDFDFEQMIIHKPNRNGPMSYWNEVLLCLFDRSYKIPRDEDTIGRIHAFADWSEWQDQPNEQNPGKHLPTCAFICFFEHICFNFAPGAIEDMPNWYNLDEVEQVIAHYPFDDADRARVRKVFELASTSSIPQ